MIDRRLMKLVSSSKVHIIKNVMYQLISLICSIFLVFMIGHIIEEVIVAGGLVDSLWKFFIIFLSLILIKAIATKKASDESFLASRDIKITLREKIYRKLLSLGGKYVNNFNTAELVQISSEGVEQLETYYGSYLPQLLYSMIAPILLFAVLSFINFKAAVILFICVPLIPLSIMLVQEFAKKMLKKYWGQYTKLGDSFLENLQGLTTLKIYQADSHKHEEMNKEAENFRLVTMKVLRLQLNSIVLMDLIAYGGAALGIIISLLELRNGNISLMGSFAITMLSIEFFLPMRLLGSYFHVAMNGMAAGDKIFKLLDTKNNKANERVTNIESYDLYLKDVSFSYDNKKKALNDINMVFKENSFTSIIGKSGCGKSTIAAIITGKLDGYKGSIELGKNDLRSISEKSLNSSITYIGMSNYIFSGSIKDNLLMADENASDEKLWEVLETVKLKEFLLGKDGLDTALIEAGANLSGGQNQKLSIARGLLNDSKIFIFDEATSNIDSESENEIIDLIYKLKNKKTVILISHRLYNVTGSDVIYVLNEGKIVGQQGHEKLLKISHDYKKMWETQSELENYKGVKSHE